MSKGLGVWTTALLLDTFHTMLEVLLELRVPFDRPNFWAALFREPENLMLYSVHVLKPILHFTRSFVAKCSHF